ncbi:MULTISPECIES: 2-amino-4-hydroxy-6-hydroxymethyldihydropteridine diphosphokinase [Aequorivita]|uniref:2-amino-4-hydroxy-6-hydroxymethyldihydropteridine pyrophosphokinase n=1 Tax=Aequorivita iocasae TaxID=2803865 RepID=A0ABX7DUX4_9FLAO|nr:MULTISPECIES: 2-amino-4-hydroxy-6-hydroxymethyldihydropteridine diphosphokinase [Aequorivita]QQX77955.1 2-amino-4-hydroxy-6-hydroxymethyldihydropteridine diphosphokinase [Aequorivita iocasae]UCA57457.1 2-amino-4-hydroxy-6-hydroxymethyldihydropteridine diphosphokinase [Aequorivita sp. F7]
MQPLYNVYLSLGSNMGNRSEYLQNAVNSLFEEVGSIVKISSVYQTPAMGFDGDPFLNCAVWLQTNLKPATVLKSILQIEKTMGRKRNALQAYTSRPIDIDIILIDDLIIESEKLTVPHPEMQKRKFVLQPLADLNSHLIHPVFEKNIIKILAESEDSSVLQKQSKWLTNPMKDYNISQYNYIAIEGNIGAGKTSLATKIANDFNAKLILERFKDNPFLPKFYEDAARYAFPLEMSFLADRYQQLVDDITQFDLFKESVIADYDVNKSLIFAGITLPEEEYALYKKLFQVMHKDVPKPDKYIYLYQNTDRLLENIKKRGRKYEQSIEASYLQKLNAGYLEFIKNQHSENIKIINISELDFLKKRADYLCVLKKIIS